MAHGDHLEHAGLTEERRRILLHMTGLSRSANQYRNHYAASEGGTSWADLLALVELGLLRRGVTDHKTFGGLTFFHATEAGVALSHRLKAEATHGD